MPIRVPGVTTAIEVEGLQKSYGDFQAVKGIDLHVEEGEIFSLLGPNGAGKTTTVEILEGYRKRSAGRVSVLGLDPASKGSALRQRIGIVLQETGVERFLTVAEVIDLFRGYYPNPRPLDEIIEVVGLQEKRDVLVRRLSGGQQRRLDVAIGLAGDPDLLFLDEPTTGFDPGARRGAWEMIRNLKSLGKTIFLTTHYMEEAQVLSDRVAIIVAGEIVAEGSPDELVSGAGRISRISFREPAVRTPALPRRLKNKSQVKDGRVVIEVADPVAALNELTTWAMAKKVELDELAVGKPSLEEVFLKLTGLEEGAE